MWYVPGIQRKNYLGTRFSLYLWLERSQEIWWKWREINFIVCSWMPLELLSWNADLGAMERSWQLWCLLIGWGVEGGGEKKFSNEVKFFTQNPNCDQAKWAYPQTSQAAISLIKSDLRLKTFWRLQSLLGISRQHFGRHFAIGHGPCYKKTATRQFFRCLESGEYQ